MYVISKLGDQTDPATENMGQSGYSVLFSLFLIFLFTN